MEHDETVYEVPSEPEVGDKYKTAADIANRSLSAVLEEIAPNKLVAELCEYGDRIMGQALREVYPAVQHKGIAFPTCVSPGRIVCHYSPGPDDDPNTRLQPGETVRVDLGVHIDGYIAQVGHTVVMTDETVTGRAADAMAACEVGAAAVMRLMRPGNSSVDVTRALEKAADNFGVTAIDGVLSHELKRYVIDGSRCIIQAETAEHATDGFEFAPDQVFAVDIAMASSLEARLTEADDGPHVYKRVPNMTYSLRLKSSRKVLSAAMHQFHGMPFPLRSLDRRQGKLGIGECWQHRLVDALPVMRSVHRRDAVVRCTFTVIITPEGPVRLTGHDWQSYQSEKPLADPDLQHLLNN